MCVGTFLNKLRTIPQAARCISASVMHWLLQCIALHHAGGPHSGADILTYILPLLGQAPENRIFIRRVLIVRGYLDAPRDPDARLPCATKLASNSSAAPGELLVRWLGVQRCWSCRAGKPPDGATSHAAALEPRQGSQASACHCRFGKLCI
jgi:hypothetical protein